MNNDHDVSNANQAQALAEALGDGGCDESPELSPNSYIAAREAYCIWFFGRGVRDWRAFHAKLKMLPSFDRYERLGELCRNALDHRDMPDHLFRPVAYAWGYFEALAKAKRAEFEREIETGRPF